MLMFRQEMEALFRFSFLYASPSRPLRTQWSLMLSAAHVKSSSTTPGASSEPPPSPDSRSNRDGWRPEPRHDRRPRVKVHRLRAYQPAHPVKLSKMARKRTQQRWSGLLTRIAKQVRATLGDAQWAERGSVTPSATRFFAAWAPHGRVPAQLPRRRDMRESVRSRARPPRGTTASTARCCAICSSRCTTTRRTVLRCCASIAAPCTDSAVRTTATSTTCRTTARHRAQRGELNSDVRPLPQLNRTAL
jgi:hypothetical protein